MDINTVIINIEKNGTEFKVFQLNVLFKFKYPFWRHRILHCVIENYL